MARKGYLEREERGGREKKGEVVQLSDPPTNSRIDLPFLSLIGHPTFFTNFYRGNSYNPKSTHVANTWGFTRVVEILLELTSVLKIGKRL